MKNWTEEELKEVQARISKGRTVTVHEVKDPGRDTLQQPRDRTKNGGWVKGPSRLEKLLERQLKANNLTGYVTEHKPLPPRRWRLDFAWVERKFAVEVQGMVHRIKDKFRRDLEKRQQLLLAGWKVVEVGKEDIEGGLAVEIIRRLLEARDG